MPEHNPLQRRALQLAIAIGGLVPVGAGLAGVVFGPDMIPDTPHLSNDLDSHWRYLSGLLMAIGLGFWSTIPATAQNGARFRMLAGLVVIGGIARVVSLLVAGTPAAPMMFALAMELVVTPALALWQYNIADPQPIADTQS